MIAARPLRSLAVASALVVAVAVSGCSGPVSFRARGSQQVATAAEAQRLYESGEFAKSAEMLRGLVAANPRDLELRRRLSLSEAAAGDPKGAAAQLNAVLARAPKDHESLFRLAMLERASGETTSAEAHLARAASVSPKTSSYVEELAKTRMLMGKPAEANKLWTQLLRSTSLSAERRKSYLVQQGESLIALGRAAEAAEAWREALRLDPRDEALKARIAALDRQ